MTALIGVALGVTGCVSPDSREARHEVAPLYSAASPTFKQASGSLLGSSYIGGNQIVSLVNGREIVPAMLSGIRSARRTIDFETYVMWDGDFAKQLTAALVERARAGVTVNAILDAQGTGSMGSENLEALQSAGVHVVSIIRFGSGSRDVSIIAAIASC